MGKLILGLVIGLVSGGVLTFFLFVGPPRSSNVPGVQIAPPDPNGLPAGTAQVVLRDDFFNSVLGTIFQQMNSPVFPLGGGQQQAAASTQPACPSEIRILPQGSGVQTGASFDENQLKAPIAFTGNYESPFGCLQFSGWAQARMDLRFDQPTQTVFGQLTVETVNLDGINPFFSGLVTPIVQSTLNSRVNPIKLIDGRQLAVNMPITAANGNLQASVTDVRADVKDSALNLYVIYGFQGAPWQPQ